MISVDTNILVYARREEAPYHREARELLVQLAEGIEPWGIAWPVIYEYIRVVTHAKVFSPPSPIDAVIEDLMQLSHSPSLTLFGPGSHHMRFLKESLNTGDCKGNLVHDGHIAALAAEHGVSRFFTCDSDFRRFSFLNVQNPFR